MEDVPRMCSRRLAGRAKLPAARAPLAVPEVLPGSAGCGRAAAGAGLQSVLLPCAAQRRRVHGLVASVVALDQGLRWNIDEHRKSTAGESFLGVLLELLISQRCGSWPDFTSGSSGGHLPASLCLELRPVHAQELPTMG